MTDNMYNLKTKLNPYNFEGLKYEQYMKWDKKELAKYILDINENLRAYRYRIRLLESKISKLRGKL